MAECTACRAEIASFDRRCWSCGAGVKRDIDKLFSGAPTDKELSRARLAHLLALPGMLILGFFYIATVGGFGLIGLFPLNLLIPFIYWLSHLKSGFIRGHAAEALNFQLLWTPAIYVSWVWVAVEVAYGGFSYGIWVAIAVWIAGSWLVLIAASDAASAGDGRYPVRIPIFR